MAMNAPREYPLKRRRQNRSAVTLLNLFAPLLLPCNAFQPTLGVRRGCVRYLDARKQFGFQCSAPCHQERQRAMLWDDASGAADAGKENGISSETNAHWISPEHLESLKTSVDILSVIESFGLPGFQRRGESRATALCPFHDDRNPSLSIDGQRRLYKCFSCGAGGDVFNFVRQYNAINGHQLTFYQAVRHVADHFGDPNLAIGGADISSKEKVGDEDRKAITNKKQRMLLANAAAASFYGKCLMTLPSAGPARTHLRTRGLSPPTVRTFAMGYAPDAYFQPKGEWGEGSLVYYLRDMGFSADEIVDSGLATRTKRALRKDVVEQSEGMINKDAHIADSDSFLEDYTTLIDRFRARLMVPIFDSTGKKVVGFGGRILSTEQCNNEHNADFKAPKYLNSPESLVFQKKNELFGQHYASEAVRRIRNEQSVGPVSGQERGSVVIVEGYMDAISLCEVGIRNVVASMGTALTIEQLASASKIAGIQGGRVVLCLDSDDAGLNAIERLCSGSQLAKTCETHVVEIVVATLPPGIKDPAEFIESMQRNSSNVAENFRKEVLDTARDWTSWYLDRLLSRYDANVMPGLSGSFVNICDRIAEFLSTFPNPVDRTKRAHEVAGSLTAMLSKNTASVEVSSSLRIQLESDLINMVARKAGARQSATHRLDTVDGVSPSTGKKMRKFATVYDMASSDDTAKLSARSLKAAGTNKMQTDGESPGHTRVVRNEQGSSSRVKNKKGAQTSNDPHRRERSHIRRNPRTPKPLPLTPHFSGFEFENQSDADWLGLPRDKWKNRKKDLTLGTLKDPGQIGKAMAARNVDDYVPGLIIDELVYFNSNHYHGHQFLTPDAANAGYSTTEVMRDASILEFGVASLLQHDDGMMAVAAEDKLLRRLVESGAARKAIKTALATSDATGSRSRIDWSSPERAWLFASLVEQSDEIPSDLVEGRHVEGLRIYLANKADAPADAFSNFARFAGRDESHEEHALVDGESTIDFLLDSLGMGSLPDVTVSSSSEVFDSGSGQALLGVPSEINITFGNDDLENSTASCVFTVNDVRVSEGPWKQTTLEPNEPDPFGFSFEARLRDASKEAILAGSLDIFFESVDDAFAVTYDHSVALELRAELDAQESLALLLRASALKGLATIKCDLIAANRALNVLLEAQNSPQFQSSNDRSTSEDADIVEHEGMEIADLKVRCEVLARKLRDSSEAARQLDVSAKRMGSRLMDYTNAEGLEGRLSIAQQEELANMVDDYVAKLPDGWRAQNQFIGPAFGDRLVNEMEPSLGWMNDGDDFDGKESLEKEMARISSEWGEWGLDDFRWSPEDTKNSLIWARANNGADTDNISADEVDDMPADEESLDDALERLDIEWGEWNDDNQTVVTRLASPSNPHDLFVTDYPENENLEDGLMSPSEIPQDPASRTMLNPILAQS